uniref:Uncharacterized protein n=1 Tax=Isometrus maculatus TaxID=497827 RepID=A0A0U1S4P9_ISOMC|nr:hypothetical protein [Isometrus maculatus]
MSKLFVFLVIALVASVSAIPYLGGAKDHLGNYYDYATGQYSSSLTGRVYNHGYYGHNYGHGLYW